MVLQVAAGILLRGAAARFRGAAARSALGFTSGSGDEFGRSVADSARATVGSMSLSVKDNIDAVARRLTDVERRQLPFALARAMTLTAKDAQKAVTDEMRRVFDRPTRYTINSTFIKPARKTDLTATLAVREFGGKGTAAANFLEPQIKGVRRKLKRFERSLQSAGQMPKYTYAMPGQRVRLDRYGNVSRGTITKVLSALKATSDASQRATASVRSAKTQARNRYVAFTKPRGRLVPGVYQRRAGGGLSPIFVYTRAPRYRKRLRFWEIANATASMRFPMQLRRSLAMALRTAK